MFDIEGYVQEESASYPSASPEDDDPFTKRIRDNIYKSVFFLELLGLLGRKHYTLPST
jgi:hypothetical protein